MEKPKPLYRKPRSTKASNLRSRYENMVKATEKEAKRRADEEKQRRIAREQKEKDESKRMEEQNMNSDEFLMVNEGPNNGQAEVLDNRIDQEGASVSEYEQLESSHNMRLPMPLIETVDDRFEINVEALNILKSVDKPLVCVSIAGLTRTGKSYLLNRLAGSTVGFPLGKTIESTTKGIWMWIKPHPLDPNNKALLLMDTEGLGDPTKGDETHDAKLFSLAVLTSSLLVYNSMGAIDQTALEKLHLVTNLSDHIKTSSRVSSDFNDDDNFDKFFPSFIWALRDFALLLEIEGKDVTPNEYLEHCLKLDNRDDNRARKYNSLRMKLRDYFRRRTLLVFDRPTSSARKLRELENLLEIELDVDFVQQTRQFCRFVYENAPVKLLDSGEQVRGSMLANLCEIYVNSINDGVVPCIEDAVFTMSKIENEKAIEEALKVYVSLVNDSVRFPMEVEELSSIFTSCNRQAVDVFLKHSVLDKKHEYQRKLGDLIVEENKRFEKNNGMASREKCERILEENCTNLKNNVKNGVYARSDGFKAYCQHLDEAVAAYKGIPGKGIMENIVLLEFLDKKSEEKQALMKVDTEMTIKEKQIEEERQKAEIERIRAKQAEDEAEQAMMRETKYKQMFEDNLETLKHKHESDMKRIEEQYAKVLNDRLSEQKRLLGEGFTQKASLLGRTIAELKSQMLRPKSSCFASTSRVRIMCENGIITKSLDKVKVGDSIESFDSARNRIVFSPVYFITHDGNDDEKYDIIELRTPSTFIQLDEFHLIYSSKDKHDMPVNPIKAGNVEVGNWLWVRSPEDDSKLIAEKVIGKYLVGGLPVRHPMTLNHHIIVEGIHASVHMFNETLYRCLTWPIRALYHVSPSFAANDFVRKSVEAWDNVEFNFFI